MFVQTAVDGGWQSESLHEVSRTFLFVIRGKSVAVSAIAIICGKNDLSEQRVPQ